jgi:hypothetical protein
VGLVVVLYVSLRRHIPSVDIVIHPTCNCCNMVWEI